MDIKARSKAMREILTKLVERARGAIEVKVFGDKVILDEGKPSTLPLLHKIKEKITPIRRRKLATMRCSYILLLDRLPTRQSHFLREAPQTLLHQRPPTPGAPVGQTTCWRNSRSSWGPNSNAN